jgi:hypothetical protein
MTTIRCEHFNSPVTMLYGMGDLRRRGVTPRGLLFLALEASGGIHVAVPDDVDEVTRIKVSEKMALKWPLEGRFFHFDSIHRLREGFYLINGDRRIMQLGNAAEVATLVADFLKSSSAHNVFFGCTPHQPGSWLIGGKDVVALHEAGFVEVVPIAQGLLARRTVDNNLWLHTFRDLASQGRLASWNPVFQSPLGNILMLERRVIGDRLVLSCERGLVEVDLAAMPTVKELARVSTARGLGVVGRVERTAFAVTQGKPEEWGLDNITPATLVGVTDGTLRALGEALSARRTTQPPST